MKANEAAKLYANTHTEWFDSEGNPNVAPAFEAGAHWAVQTMIEKACEWLENNVEMYNAYNPTVESYYSGKERMLEDFKKVMEK